MGPLHGLRVVEMASIGPGRFCGMVLADLGSDVLRVERPGGDQVPWHPERDPLLRGRHSIEVDLKQATGSALVLRLVEKADVLIEGFRPGVAERLGIGPDECRERNRRLVYGRMTGYGQEGPMAGAAGHDIDYIAISGALHAIGRIDSGPTPPLNLVGDFGGGGMLLAVGVLAALWERERSGEGQVVDAAMVDGSALLTAMQHGMMAVGAWDDRRGVNLLDSGAPFYDSYETSDGGWMAVGALESHFFTEMVELVGIDFDPGDQYDRALWPELRDALDAAFRTRTRDEWVAIFDRSDACVAPVLSLGEAPHHPHNRHRATFIEVNDVVQPAPAPRFGRTASEEPRPPATATADWLEGWGLGPEEIDAFRESGSIA
jgi:alpha-methylacyl-CoA racemase